MFIVSDEVLENLVCASCNRYLSVVPVKVYPNGGIKCGRCCTIADAGVTSLFAVVANDFLFPCINLFNGCNELLPYTKVAEHEKECHEQDFVCLACPSQFKAGLCSLYNHFKKQHNDLLLSHPEIVLDLKNEPDKIYMYRKRNLLFYINVNYDSSTQELSVNIRHLGSRKTASQINQEIIIGTVDGKIVDKSPIHPCCSVDEWNAKSFMLQDKNVFKDVVICKIHLDTENAERFICLPSNLKMPSKFKFGVTAANSDKSGLLLNFSPNQEVNKIVPESSESQYEKITISKETEFEQTVNKNDHLLRSLLRDPQVPTEYQNYIGKTYRSRLLDELSPEYQFVRGLFSDGFNRKFRIRDIIKNWNPCLLLQYTLKKRYLGDGFSERYLFHGTSYSAAFLIIEENFDWRKVVNKKFGQGVSFASNSGYASHYSLRHDQSHPYYHMILAKVLVERGELPVGNNETTIPDTGSSTRNKDGQVLVKYDDAMFYPDFLVLFEKK